MLMYLLDGALGLLSLSLLLALWYKRLVSKAQANVYFQDGTIVPGETPQPLVGNLPEVYGAPNQLSAYNDFHRQFGKVVQIMWLWRHQLSVASHPMALHVLKDNAHQYEKFPANGLLRQLYGASVLTNNGNAWKRHRLILNEFFTEKAVLKYHDTIERSVNRLINQWQKKLTDRQSDDGSDICVDICQELNPLFLETIIRIVIGDPQQEDLQQKIEASDRFLHNLTHVLKASTHPLHQFVSWWRFMPLPQNRRLTTALAEVESFLDQLILNHQLNHQIAHQADAGSSNMGGSNCVLSKLLQATNDTTETPLTHAEIRANLLAIIGNGYETVATTLAMSLQALAQDPKIQSRARDEVYDVFEAHPQFGNAGVSALTYLEAVIYESMRLYPAVAGLQRVSLQPDVIAGWSIPAKQAVGITLEPLHQDARYYGDSPEVFEPERYSRCPFTRTRAWLGQSVDAIRKPLTFGEGARQCLGRHLAMYEMKLTLALLLKNFSFEMHAPEPVKLELGKFGVFISAFPKSPVTLKLKAIETVKPAETTKPILETCYEY